MRKEVTPEEKNAKEFLEKYIYKNKKLMNFDKPDIQSVDGTIGIEHVLITTETAEMQVKMQKIIEEKHISLLEVFKLQDDKFHESNFGCIVGDSKKVDGLFSFPKETLLEMIEKAFSKKYPKINNGGYKVFERYDLFLTLHNDWITNDDFSKITSLIEKYNKKFDLYYHKIFILKSYSLLVFENGTCTEIFFERKKLIKNVIRKYKNEIFV